MLTFERLETTVEPKAVVDPPVYRAKVPGGWLLLMPSSTVTGSYQAMTFVPDSNHHWDGSSLP